MFYLFCSKKIMDTPESQSTLTASWLPVGALAITIDDWCRETPVHSRNSVSGTDRPSDSTDHSQLDQIHLLVGWMLIQPELHLRCSLLDSFWIPHIYVDWKDHCQRQQRDWVGVNDQQQEHCGQDFRWIENQHGERQNHQDGGTDRHLLNWTVCWQKNCRKQFVECSV